MKVYSLKKASAITTPDHSKKQKKRNGFTLIEMLFSTSVLGLVMAGLVSNYVFIFQSSLALGNYSDMARESTYFLETMGRELRMAEDVQAVASDRFTVVVPYSTGDEVVQYRYYSDLKSIYRIEGASSDKVLSNVEDLTFTYYNNIHAESNDLLEVKAVQMEATLQRDLAKLKNTDHIISARYTMRNRTVSN